MASKASRGDSRSGSIAANAECTGSGNSGNGSGSPESAANSGNSAGTPCPCFSSAASRAPARRTVDGGTLLFNHESAPLAKRLNEQRNADVVEEALKDALGVGLKVRFEVGSATEAPASPSAGVDVARVQRDEEDSMLAEAGNDDSETVRRDPEEAALELLQNELGARRIDGG